jgi:predicted TIM-barrel fold metal-dependent hydrolase
MSNSKDSVTITTPVDAPSGISRRQVLTAGAATFMFLQRRAEARPMVQASFFDSAVLAQAADRDPALRPPIIVDAQTHVWWRSGGPQSLTPSGEHFLKTLAGSRAAVVGKPVPIADMGRLMFIEDMFLNSETDIAFLNSFGMRAAFDGVDLFPPREAAMIRSMAPTRIRVLGVVDPPDGQSAVDSLIYQCEELKIDGLKLYPPGPVKTGWRMDDQKTTYPLYEVLRKHGAKTVCVHKGLPGLFIEEYCHTEDLARAAADFPDLNFIAFHCAFPFEAELAAQAKRAKTKNIYAEMGGLAPYMYRQPERYAQMLGTIIDGLGADHVLWGTDTPVAGPPHWQIQAFQAYTFPEQFREKHGYQQLTPQVKRQIFGENAARLFSIDIPAVRRDMEGDLLYRLRVDGNPLPAPVDPASWPAG